MNDNHTWVICAYGESDYLEACIQSLKINSSMLKLSAIVQRHWIRLRNLCQRYAIPFYTKQGGGIGKDWNNAISFVENKNMLLSPIRMTIMSQDMQKSIGQDG